MLFFQSAEEVTNDSNLPVKKIVDFSIIVVVMPYPVETLKLFFLYKVKGKSLNI